MSKHLVFIVSGGRTGTRFFGDLLMEMIEDCFSVHEPDLFDVFTRRTWGRLKTFGFGHMVVGRLMGRTGIRNLTQRRLSGVASEAEIDAAIRKHRHAYYSSLPATLIVESYYQWFGLLPAVRREYPACKIVGILRDPRTWVASWMNFGSHHDRRDLVRLFGQRRLDPTMIGDKDYAQQWSSMSRFEKLCWDWRTIYQQIIDFSEADSRTQLYRYEDLFLSIDRRDTVIEMLEFITRFEDRQYYYELQVERLKKRVHSSTRKTFPGWRDWSPELARTLDKLCGNLMVQFGYGQEPEWQLKLAG
jgi:hypothetical protein